MSYLGVTSGRVATTSAPAPYGNITVDPTNIPIANIVTPMANPAVTPMLFLSSGPLRKRCSMRNM